MKGLNDYISEAGIVRRGMKINGIVIPENKQELIGFIKERIDRYGNNCNLNDIITTKITDMSELFSWMNFGDFNGDISKWDVSNVRNMSRMFYNSEFDGDLSKWDVRNVQDMSNMFGYSKFSGKKGGISEWKVNRVLKRDNMFENSKFEGDISKWKFPNRGDLMYRMFYGCPLQDNPPQWYKDKCTKLGRAW